MISANAPAAQKKYLSGEFLKTCAIGLLPHPLFAIEEPLVLATQLVFMKNTYPEVYNKEKNAFGNPFIFEIENLLEAYLRENRSIDLEFINKYADLCKKFNLT